MIQSKPHTLICTLGTSLFKPNLYNLPGKDRYNEWIHRQPESDRQFLNADLIEDLKENLKQENWQNIAFTLNRIPGSVRLCGAEINSITDLIERGYCTPDCTLVFCHSDTTEGWRIAKILENYYQLKGHHVQQLQRIQGLQDENPKIFRTKGLRELSKHVCRIIKETGSSNFCAINATGGYKAQIAIAVLMGQALEVPVYYKHEKFSEIIGFPPMPISLDFNLWLEKSGLLGQLNRKEIIAWDQYEIEEDWNEKMESLVERVENDGKTDCLELSPTGQIFYETFKGRFSSQRDEILPPKLPKSQKYKPKLSHHNWGNAREKILKFLQKITDECAYVRSCQTEYWNKDLSSPTLFRLKGEDIQGVFSDGTWTVKFTVDTSANTMGQRLACIADLNERVENWI
ncbi:putative CRISPR-associated protein [Geitlerinema sp. PCC 9228]|uniref:putative CRISPR-associated protein n=1 Tax=Geitlerinema sp. PCC 9228 TaxID=111611 RepID=UPI0008F99EF9|nr:putative CRISPR-associated protein [Geitlerinema sp. PCC 9228]